MQYKRQLLRLPESVSESMTRIKSDKVTPKMNTNVLDKKRGSLNHSRLELNNQIPINENKVRSSAELIQFVKFGSREDVKGG